MRPTRADLWAVERAWRVAVPERELLSVRAALERIGDDPEARFRFYRRLLAVAEQ